VKFALKYRQIQLGDENMIQKRTKTKTLEKLSVTIAASIEDSELLVWRIQKDANA
jgi:hypothetical protein